MTTITQCARPFYCIQASIILTLHEGSCSGPQYARGTARLAGCVPTRRGSVLLTMFSRLGHKQRASLPAYFPLKAGASWHYHYGPVEELRATLAPDLQPNVHRAGIGSVYFDGKHYEGLMSETGCEAFGISEQEVVVRGGADAEGRVTRLLLCAPPVVGTTWQTGSSRGQHSSGRIAGVDVVETPTGSFECLRVETVSSAGSMTACWYAPGVGLVQQYTSADDHMLLLHSHFIPPDDFTASLEIDVHGPGQLELLLGGNRTGLYGGDTLPGLMVGSHEVGAARGRFQVIKRCTVGVPEQEAAVRLEVPPAEEVRPGGLQPFVNRIVPHPDGSLWFCTHGYGVWVHQPHRWLDNWCSLNPHNTLVDDYVTDAVFPDDSSALFGTRGHGVIALRRSEREVSYRPLFASHQTGAEAFVTVLIIHEGRLFVGTEDQGLLVCDLDGAASRVPDLEAPAILCLAEVAQGLLVGTEQGAWLLQGNQVSRLESLGSRAVLAAHPEPTGRLLVGLREGGLLAVGVSGESEPVVAEQLIGPEDSVFDISADDQGNLYACTGRGVCQVSAEGECRLFEIQDAEGALAARRVGPDLWIAARPGIWRVSLDGTQQVGPGE